MCDQRSSGKPARMLRLAWAFAGRLCDKYPNLMSWLIYDARYMYITSRNHIHYANVQLVAVPCTPQYEIDT